MHDPLDPSAVRNMVDSALSFSGSANYGEKAKFRYGWPTGQPVKTLSRLKKPAQERWGPVQQTAVEWLPERMTEASALKSSGMLLDRTHSCHRHCDDGWHHDGNSWDSRGHAIHILRSHGAKNGNPCLSEDLAKVAD